MDEFWGRLRYGEVTAESGIQGLAARSASLVHCAIGVKRWLLSTAERGPR